MPDQIKKKAVFLDRDGVINQLVIREGTPRAPYTLEDFKLFDGVENALEKLVELNFLRVVVTNQPDVARGWVTKESVEMINNKIRELLPLSDIKICFHTNSDNCDCRKPAPGMLLSAAQDFNIDLAESYMIGDRYSDIKAGVSAGCMTILVGPGDTQGDYPNPDFRAESLEHAVSIISERHLSPLK